MVLESSAEELPPGWTEHVKVFSTGRKIKYYTHQEKGLKFYSKKRVLFHDKMQTCEGTLQLVSEQKQENSPSKSDDPSKSDEDSPAPEWLPRGWMVECRSRKKGAHAGYIYKIYVELKTGHRFRSKAEVMKYLDSVNSNSTPEKQKPGGSGVKYLKQDALEDPLPMVGKSIITTENNYQLVEVSFEEVSAHKCLTQDAPPNLQPVVHNSIISGRDDNDMVNVSLEVVHRSPVVDGFPPGWVKELRPRNKDRNKMDPYYIDPVSGYEFRSKMDALRYMETGDIRSCKIKPKKSLVKYEDGTSAPRMTDCCNIDPIAIDYHGAVSSSPTAALQSSNLSEANKSIVRDTYSISTDSKSKTVDANGDNKLIPEVIECRGSEHSSEANIKGSKLSTKFDDDRAVSVTGTELQDNKHAEDQLDIKKQISLKKAKRKAQNIPARSSKRLSGEEPEMQPMMLSSQRTQQSASKKSAEKEASVSVKEQKAAVSRLSHHVDINQESELHSDPPFSFEVATSLEAEIQNKKPSGHQDVPFQADLPSSCKVASFQTGMRNNNEKPCLGQDLPKQALGKVKEKPGGENLGSQGSHVWYPFGDTLSDPCYEFAFKTLTGEIPLEETLAFQNLFQQPVGGSCTQGALSLGIDEIGTSPLFQNDVPYQLDPVRHNLPGGQLPSKPNINLASCANFGDQQPSLEARSKDYKTKVNS